MRFIDSHVHLGDTAFDSDRDAVVERSRVAGATHLVAIGESLAAAARACDIAKAHPGFVSFTAGLHPHDAATFDEARDVPLLAALLAPGAVAVGECGLDAHYDHSPRAAQLEALAAQVALAREHELPVVLHTRDAERDTTEVLRDAGRSGVRGVMHCFTGSHALAHAALEAGWYISFSGIITFRKFDDEPLLRLVPDDRLLVESDAPYLAPVPYRGTRNEPAWVASTLQRLAMARGADAAALGEQTRRNTITLFGLPEDA